jgi:hypothetical protein
MSRLSASPESEAPPPEVASIPLIRLMSAELRKTPLDDERAVELTADFREIVGAARAAARDNVFTDEPSRYLCVLNRLGAEGAGSP